MENNMNNKQKSVLTMVDFYKVDHISQYPIGTTNVFSNFTPRSSRLFNGSEDYDSKVVNFGMQRYLIDYLINEWNGNFFDASKKKSIKRYKRRMDNALGKGAVKTSQIESLYDLGYLPLVIRAFPEGTRSPIGVPVFTVTNTHDDFFWLVNYIESVTSTETWKAYTMATVAFEFRRTFEKYAELTGADKDFIQFQGHDFSMRGLSNRHEAYTNSIAHLTCFAGTDTIPAIDGAEDFYYANSDKELVGTSVYASEHATITMNIGTYIAARTKGICKTATDLPERSDEWTNTDWQRDIDDCIKDGFKFINTPDDSFFEIINDGCVRSCTRLFAHKNSSMDLDNLEDRQQAELEVLKYMITEVYPTGIYSHVSDSYDYWHTLSVTLRKLKKDILDRQVNEIGLAKLTIRPDSGSPEKIICGLQTKELIFSDEDLFENETGVNKFTPEIILNYARNTISNNYDGYNYDGVNYDWSGREIPDAELKGSLEVLWEIFGGEVNVKGFRVLNPRIGLIYGDSITTVRQEQILKRMMEMGFASSNIIFGVGSYSYQYMTRDSLGFAMKATCGTVDGKLIPIFKDPKTDSGTKKSAKGLLAVNKIDGEYVLKQNCSWADVKSDDNELKIVFQDGKLKNQTTLFEIRERINSEFE